MDKVFVSYSHDSKEHSAKVLALSNRLRALGVDVELDRYQIRPPQGWPRWCEEQLRPEVSRYVLVICTPAYRARVEGRAKADEGRGVYWEGTILYNYLYNEKENARFIPILLDEAEDAGIPLPLDGHTRYRVCTFELTDPGFEALYRELTRQPATPKPKLGKRVQIDVDAARAKIALPEKLVESNFDREAFAASRAGFWSLVSTEESVARGEWRFWAVIETAAAIAIFWWTALHYESFMLLFTSMFVAPLLLLRSEESIQLGVKWIDKGMTPPSWPDAPKPRMKAKASWERRWAWIAVMVGVSLGLGLGFPLASIYLVDHDGWVGFLLGLIFEIAIVWTA